MVSNSVLVALNMALSCRVCEAHKGLTDIIEAVGFMFLPSQDDPAAEARELLLGYTGRQKDKVLENGSLGQL